MQASRPNRTAIGDGFAVHRSRAVLFVNDGDGSVGITTTQEMAAEYTHGPYDRAHAATTGPAVPSLADILPRLVLPLGLVLQCLLVALLLRRWRPRTSTGLTAAAILLLWVFSTPRVSGFLIGSLEARHPGIAAEQAPCADAIVLLGGGLQMPHPPRPDAQLGPGADRLLVALRLWQANRAPVIVLSAGGNDDPRLSESAQTARLLNEWGVPMSALVQERRSTNTEQNATESARILEELESRHVLLVTSASHMPRAMALFRGSGIEATAIPADHWISDAPAVGIVDWIPDGVALGGSSRALREYLGLLWYAFQGRIRPADVIAQSATTETSAAPTGVPCDPGHDPGVPATEP